MTDCGAVEGNKLDRDETRNGSPEDGEVEDNNIHPPNGHTSVDMRVCVFSFVHVLSSKTDNRKQFQLDPLIASRY